MSGHDELIVPEHRYELHAGQDFLKSYRFGHRLAEHLFCVVCGIKPFCRPRSHPCGYFSVNARCLDLSAAEHVTYVEFDGRNWEDSMAAGQHVVAEEAAAFEQMNSGPDCGGDPRAKNRGQAPWS
jgi:hypothetical protein